MGRTGSGKSHPISKSLPTNASLGSMKIEPGLFCFCIFASVPASEIALLTYSLRSMSKHRMKSKLHSAKNPAAFQHVRESFARQGLMKHLGAELTELSPGKCEIRVRHREKLTQQHGYFHAGVTASIADSVSGYAAYSMMPPDSSVLTVEYKINLVAPAEGKLLIARGRVLRSGRTLKICAADVFVVNGKQEILCATSLSTVMVLPGQSDTSRSRYRPSK
jgi:uncharacterized protein (TIGR00369 family)